MKAKNGDLPQTYVFLQENHYFGGLGVTWETQKTTQGCHLVPKMVFQGPKWSAKWPKWLVRWPVKGPSGRPGGLSRAQVACPVPMSGPSGAKVARPGARDCQGQTLVH